eukprot:4008105-Amphidinium_carterae.1
MTSFCDDIVHDIRTKYPVPWLSTCLRWGSLDFDSTLGFPGEGPKRSQSAPAPVDLSLSVLPATRATYMQWLVVQCLANDTVAWSQQPSEFTTVLCDYLQWLVDHKQPRTHGIETLAALQHFYPHLQGQIGRAWLHQRV